MRERYRPALRFQKSGVGSVLEANFKFNLLALDDATPGEVEDSIGEGSVTAVEEEVAGRKWNNIAIEVQPPARVLRLFREEGLEDARLSGPIWFDEDRDRFGLQRGLPLPVPGLQLRGRVQQGHALRVQPSGLEVVGQISQFATRLMGTWG